MFDFLERSLTRGKPLRLYRFTRGALRWSYTSGNRDITLNNEIFRAVAGGISDAGIQQSGDPDADRFVITAPGDLPVAQLFRGTPPSGDIEVEVFNLHQGDTEMEPVWPGQISGVNWPQLNTVEITCLSLESTVDRPGLTLTYSRGCTACLYDHLCRVDRTQWQVPGMIESVAGAVIIVPDFAALEPGWLTNGYLEWTIGSGEIDRVAIESHDGQTIHLLRAVTGLKAGMDITAYPGCDYSIQMCHEKFGNSDNFQGIPHLAGRSIFDGNPVGW